MSILPPVAETIDHKIFVSFFVNPSSSLPAGEGLFSDFTVTNKIPSPTIEVGVERLVGGVAESPAVRKQPEFLAMLDEQLLEFIECYFYNFVRYFCHIFCLLSFIFCLFLFLVLFFFYKIAHLILG